jgi:hypothetical protein
MTNKLVQMYVALGGMFEAASPPQKTGGQTPLGRGKETRAQGSTSLKPVKRKMVGVRGKWRSSGEVDARLPHDRLDAYMRLPLEEYSLLDESMMERLPCNEDGGQQLLRLTVPMEDALGLHLSPALDVAVQGATEEDRRVVVSSKGFTFGNDMLDREGTLEFSATLTWGRLSDPLPRGGWTSKSSKGGSRSAPIGGNVKWTRAAVGVDESNGEKTKEDTGDGEGQGAELDADGGGWIDCEVKVKCTINIPRELRIVPGPVISATGGLIADATLSMLLPKFVDLLVQDAGRWARGEVREALISNRKLELTKENYGVRSSSAPAHPKSGVIDLRRRSASITFRGRASKPGA